ncbi:MAG: replication initiator protein A, partial [Candidatus Omnitrophica bacterium]|nr:replication initiator protein A [Candidatus Omnitrophota bacterium]
MKQKPAALRKVTPDSNANTKILATTQDFVKIEKNLSTLGFFTTSKSRGRVEVRERTIRFRREIAGRIIETEATILPSAKYGLPTTADLDKYLAFQKLVNDIRLKQGSVRNPIGFTSTQMLNVLGVKNAGNNYQEVYEWLQRMTLTGISSNGVVYLARRKAWATDTFHVFDRVVALGMQMPDGSVADRNYVWLSEWQIENINNNYVMPIDFETYRKLRNHIAKALVPLLQVWLYASRSEGRFEKRYEDLCSILDINRQKHLSFLKKQLEPSLKELQFYGYLADYKIESTSDGRDYKIVAGHGPKFYRDHKTRAGLPLPAAETTQEPSLLKALLDRGLNEAQARRLLQSLPESRPILDQLEYGDWLITRSKGTIHNPPGFYTYLLRESVIPPESFETSAKRQLRESLERTKREESTRRAEDEQAYLHFCEERVNAIIAGMDQAQYQQLLAGKKQEVRKSWPKLPETSIQEIAERALHSELRENIDLPSLEEFRRRPPQ